MAAIVAHGPSPAASRDVAAVHSLPAEPAAAITAAHRTDDGDLDGKGGALEILFLSREGAGARPTVVRATDNAVVRNGRVPS